MQGAENRSKHPLRETGIESDRHENVGLYSIEVYI